MMSNWLALPEAIVVTYIYNWVTFYGWAIAIARPGYVMLIQNPNTTVEFRIK